LAHQKPNQQTLDQRTFLNRAIVGAFRATADGVYVYANPALAQIYGYESPETLLASFQQGRQRYVTPAQESLLRRMLEVQGEVREFESQVYRKDGSIIWIAESVWVVLGKERRVQFHEGLVYDITRQKRENELTAKRNERHAALINAIPGTMVCLQREGTISEYHSGQQLEQMGFSKKVVGKNIHDILPYEVARTMMEHVQRVREKGSMEVGEYQLPANETISDYEVGMVVSGTDEVLAIIRDITKRKRAERLKNEFVSIVSHELRTPLTSIRGALSLIVGAMADTVPEKALKMVQIAHKNSERLVSLVNDILDIDKIESGNMAFDLKPLEIVPLIEQSLEQNRSYGEQFGVTFLLEEEVGDTKVYADTNRLLQVLANLLSNATKFSPQGGRVTVSVSAHNANVHVRVTDQGPGIPPSFRKRIFQKFAQADSSTTRQKGGSGLGLSISKAIIERLNGEIGFETEEGVGTTFYFNLPIWNGMPMTYGTVQRKTRILICEDSPDLARMLSIMLGYCGYETDIAYTTTQAKQMLSCNQYAAMTLDLVLPGQGGIALIRELRQQEETRHLPIIIISAIAQQERSGLEGGAFEIADWLDKPVDHEQLAAAVRRAVSQRTVERPAILHVEDDADVIQVIETLLSDVADISHAMNIEEAQRKLEEQTFQLVIVDLGLPDGSGLDILPLLRNSKQPHIPVMIFSAREVGRDAVQKVTAALVKSRTSNEELVATIRSLIGKDHSGGNS
jgi:PAS domain S-box-containing protein